MDLPRVWGWDFEKTYHCFHQHIVQAKMKMKCPHGQLNWSHEWSLGAKMKMKWLKRTRIHLSPSKYKHILTDISYKLNPVGLCLLGLAESFLPLSKHVAIHVRAACNGQHKITHFKHHCSKWIQINCNCLDDDRMSVIWMNKAHAWNIDGQDNKCHVVVVERKVPFVGHPKWILCGFLQIKYHCKNP